MNVKWDDTIVALATPPGISAIGVVRLSGTNAIEIANQLFENKNLSKKKSHTLHVGWLKYNHTIIDEVVLSLFKTPNSYTGEDIVEISCHGNTLILNQIIDACIELGARPAQAGEFTQRAFLNGKIDLTQAEAVADVIAAESSSAQQTALQQLRGGFKNDLSFLREKLIHFVAMIELELDFGEEDVAFANRSELTFLINTLIEKINTLIKSYKLGNLLKNGVQVVIAGKPNAGKSTLLNALLNEERAIVTNIEGTTRDTIEENLVVDGIVFKLIDTAGLRVGVDEIEKIGIEKTYQKISESSILIYVFDASTACDLYVVSDIISLQKENKKILLVANKCDAIEDGHVGMLVWSIGEMTNNEYPIFEIIAKTGKGVQEIIDYLPSLVIHEKINSNETIVVNARHFSALQEAALWLNKVKEGLEKNCTGDLLSLDLKQAMIAIGSISGNISLNEDILGTIFSKFCIGK